MQASIQLKLYATLKALSPSSAEDYPIRPGMRLRELIRELGLQETQAKLIFVDGVQSGPEHVLRGGERVGIFPPVGGG